MLHLLVVRHNPLSTENISVWSPSCHVSKIGRYNEHCVQYMTVEDMGFGTSEVTIKGMSTLQTKMTHTRIHRPTRLTVILLALFTAALILSGIADSSPSMLEEGSIHASKLPNILLITLNAVRADKLGVYGSRLNLTPNIDSIAQGGLVLDEFIAHSPWTRSSLASLFTSLYPSQHKAQKNMQSGLDHIIDTQAITLAEILKAAGYYTCAYQSDSDAAKAYGFGRGFDTWYGTSLIDSRDNLPYAPAERVCEAFNKWFSKRKERQEPYFAWVNMMDAHMPYQPTTEYMKGIVDIDYRGPVQIPFSNYRLGRTGELTRRDRVFIESLYNAEVRKVDEGVGRIIRLLKEAREYDNTLIIITADHGEEFWDHGRKGILSPLDEHDWGFGHGHTLFDEQIHVPLIIRWPEAFGRKEKVTRIPGLFRQVDFLPTLLDTLELRQPNGVKFEGTSVLAVLQDKVKDYKAPDVFIESVLYGSELKAIRTSRYKLIMDTATKKCQLFDLRDDPAEQKDLAQKLPQKVEQLKARLMTWMKSMPHCCEL